MFGPFFSFLPFSFGGETHYAHVYYYAYMLDGQDSCLLACLHLSLSIQ